MAQPTTVGLDPYVDQGDGSFASQLKEIRRRLSAKQAWLSSAIGCTEAAVSLWESGARLPTPRSFSRILSALAESSVSPSELLALGHAWRSAAAERSETALGHVLKERSTRLAETDRAGARRGSPCRVGTCCSRWR
jgi:hypothetical protein